MASFHPSGIAPSRTGSGCNDGFGRMTTSAPFGKTILNICWALTTDWSNSSTLRCFTSCNVSIWLVIQPPWVEMTHFLTRTLMLSEPCRRIGRIVKPNTHFNWHYGRFKFPSFVSYSDIPAKNCPLSTSRGLTTKKVLTELVWKRMNFVTFAVMCYVPAFRKKFCWQKA